jgi:hypothetical protein
MAIASGGLTLQGRAADGECDVDVSARSARVGAGLVRPPHQLDCLVFWNFWGLEVDRGGEAHAARVEQPDPDPAVTRELLRSSFRPAAKRSSADWKQAA